MDTKAGAVTVAGASHRNIVFEDIWIAIVENYFAAAVFGSPNTNRDPIVE